jgi:hypothetical protein
MMASRHRSAMIGGAIVPALVCGVNAKRPSARTTCIEGQTMHQPYQQTGSSQEEQPRPKMEWRNPTLAWQGPRSMEGRDDPRHVERRSWLLAMTSQGVAARLQREAQSESSHRQHTSTCCARGCIGPLQALRGLALIAVSKRS